MDQMTNQLIKKITSRLTDNENKPWTQKHQTKIFKADLLPTGSFRFWAARRVNQWPLYIKKKVHEMYVKLLPVETLEVQTNHSSHNFNIYSLFFSVWLDFNDDTIIYWNDN